MCFVVGAARVPLMMKDRTSQTLTGGGASRVRPLMSKKSLSPQSEEEALLLLQLARWWREEVWVEERCAGDD